MKRDSELEELRSGLKRARAAGKTFREIGKAASASAANLGEVLKGTRGLGPETRERLRKTLVSMGFMEASATEAAQAPQQAPAPAVDAAPPWDDETRESLKEDIRRLVAEGVTQREIGELAEIAGTGVSNFLQGTRGLGAEARERLQHAVAVFKSRTSQAAYPPPPVEPAAKPSDEPAAPVQVPETRTRASEEEKAAARIELAQVFRGSGLNKSDFARRLGLPSATVHGFIAGQSVSQQWLATMRERVALFLEGKDPPPMEPPKLRAGKGTLTRKGQQRIIRKQLKTVLVREFKGDYGEMARTLGLHAARIKRTLQGGHLPAEDAERLWGQWFPETPWAGGKTRPVHDAAPGPAVESRQLTLALPVEKPLARAALNGHAPLGPVDAQRLAADAARMLEGWKAEAMEFVMNLAKHHRGGTET